MLGTRLAAQSNTKVVSSHKVVCTKLLRPCRPVGNSLWRHTTFRRKQWQSGAQLVAQCAEQAASTDPDGDRRSRQHFEGLPAGYRIRYATLQDADQIGKINAEVFAWSASRQMQPGPLRDYTERAEYFYMESLYKDSVESLTRSLNAKQQARRGNREVVLREQSRQLRADLARLQGRPVPPRPLEDRLQRVAMQSWRRKRQFTCLVIETDDCVVASCVLNLAAPDALLPPPFPTTKPLRLYCSNMAVSPAHRRKGLATALLQRCQRLGRLWGYGQLWLHVDVINDQAQSLYKDAGFNIQSQDGWYYIVGRKRYLMQKALPVVQKQTSVATNLTVTGGSVRNADGVFVWDVKSDDLAVVPTDLNSESTDTDTEM